MSVKWQYFLGGLLAGCILSGITFLVFSPINPSSRLVILNTNGSSEANYSGQKTSPSIQGKININTASIDELTALPGVGPSKALALIEFREKYGRFEKIEELLYVPGFGETLYTSIKEFVVVE